jgi:hypothetical protein
MRAEGALVWSAYLLRVRLGKEAAAALIEQELRWATKDGHRENVRRVLEMIRES